MLDTSQSFAAFSLLFDDPRIEINHAAVDEVGNVLDVLEKGVAVLDSLILPSAFAGIVVWQAASMIRTCHCHISRQNGFELHALHAIIHQGHEKRKVAVVSPFPVLLEDVHLLSKGIIAGAETVSIECIAHLFHSIVDIPFNKLKQVGA